ncbi:hypothetical protein BOX15_Mlig030298g1 [Macrostomum lignano]|uniref:Uncharacterized protein n=1 Tax=Macrostomum lignano TaxID=282301 RepID=A0A267GWJ6_9PLAT|nr:hypothetical protein BOX15_Mlig030298g1 [Macrostomum lignano]
MTKGTIRLPDPMFFRQKPHSGRKFSKAEKKSQNFYHMVPRFFDLYHPTTSWLVNAIRTENEKELNRVLMDKESKGLLKFEPDPRALQAKKTVIGGKKEFIITKAKYFQVIDRPEFYSLDRSSLFNRHAVMYLTPLGLAIYLRKPKAATMLVRCIDRDTNKKHIMARQPQFITFINERFGDLMCLYDHNLAMLNETYDILQAMLQHENWFPMEPYALVYRKRFVETYLNFDDFLDYAFYVMFTKRSSIDIPSLCSAVLKCPTEHFRFNYMSEPSRANPMTLLRDAERIINNCKTYPRRLLRCAFYADKKLKSTANLVRAASQFINMGIFKLVGDPAMPFVPRPGRRKRLETIPVYRERSRGINIEWPQALFEFDADCCIALMVGLLAKCYRLAKMPTFAVIIKTIVKTLADAGWLNYFDIISDLEFKDYFMGLDDAEKVRFQPEVFSFVRECARITVIDQRHELARFFTEERLDRELHALNDVQDPAVLTRMLMCNDENITNYVILDKGEELKAAGTIIGGKRTRGVGRDDPKNKYYMDRLEFPRESTKTVMTNTANTEESSGTGAGSSSDSDSDFFVHKMAKEAEAFQNLSNKGDHSAATDTASNSSCSSDDLHRQNLSEYLLTAEVVPEQPISTTPSPEQLPRLLPPLPQPALAGQRSVKRSTRSARVRIANAGSNPAGGSQIPVLIRRTGPRPPRLLETKEPTVDELGSGSKTLDEKPGKHQRRERKPSVRQ